MKFVGMPDVNWERVFSRSFIESECEEVDKTIFKKLALCFFKRRQDYALESNGASILCFQSYYKRKSYIDQMDNVAKLSKADIIRGMEPGRLRPLGLFFICARVIPWFIEIRKLKLPLWLELTLLSQLIWLDSVVVFFRKVNMSNYNLLVTFCDSILDEAFVTELFKSQGIKTATLEHGQFTAFREKSFINSGVEIRSMKSDYFLAWNPMTVDECKRSNLLGTEVVVCGILGYIGKKYESTINPHNNVFGVIINHQFFEKDNIVLIKSANKLAKELGYQYYLKLHPNYSEDYFTSYVDNKYYIGNIKKGIPILEYANMCMFSLVSSSSVFCELVYVKQDVLRYSTGDLSDKFRDVPYGLTFSNIDDVIESYKQGFDQKEKEMLFNYLCGTENVTDSYKNFFKRFE